MMNLKSPAISRSQSSTNGFIKFLRSILFILMTSQINLVWCKGGAAISGKGGAMGNAGGE